MNGNALDHTVNGTAGARRIGGIANTHGVKQAHRLGNHDERQGKVCLGKCFRASKGEGLTLEQLAGILLDCDGLHGNLVAANLMQDVQVILTRIGVVIHKHEHERLVVNKGLGSMTITHRGVIGSSGETVSELKNLELSLLGQTTEGTRTKIGHAGVIAGQESSDLFLTGNNVLTHNGCGLNPRGLLLIRGLIEDKGGEQLHAGVAASHSEALVVCPRDQDSQSVRVIGRLHGKLALRGAGEVQELDVLAHGASNIHGSQALGAVAGTSKRNEQRGVLRTQEVKGSRHDVGGSNRLKVIQVAVAGMAQVRSAGIANVIGGAGTGEDDAQTALSHGAGIGQEYVDGLLVLLVNVEGVAPQLGLLLDLMRGDISAQGFQIVDTFLEHS